ncbi:hypothetical protein RP20_CCG009069 [Aedes albopictus]|nr:hypothetical protein RP20_CCG009069 [Aedes albopictus]
MASTSKLVEELLVDLAFPSKLLQALNEAGIGVFNLLTVTEGQFCEYLKQLDCKDFEAKSFDLFEVILCWRIRIKAAIRSLVESCIFTDQADVPEAASLRLKTADLEEAFPIRGESAVLIQHPSTHASAASNSTTYFPDQITHANGSNHPPAGTSNSVAVIEHPSQPEPVVTNVTTHVPVASETETASVIDLTHPLVRPPVATNISGWETSPETGNSAGIKQEPISAASDVVTLVPGRIPNTAYVIDVNDLTVGPPVASAGIPAEYIFDLSRSSASTPVTLEAETAIEHPSRILSLASPAPVGNPNSAYVIDLSSRRSLPTTKDTTATQAANNNNQVVICAVVENLLQSPCSASSSSVKSFVPAPESTHDCVILSEVITPSNTRDEPAEKPDDTSTETRKSYTSYNSFDCNVLLGLLNQTEEGKDIIIRAQAGQLSDSKQLQLAEIVAKYHLTHREKLHREDLETYALAICTLFKSEQKVNYLYRKNYGGKVANKIGNLKKKKRKANSSEEEHTKTLKRNIPSDVAVELHDEKSIQAYEWLMLNIEPWTTVGDKWPLSFSKRQPLLASHSAVAKVFTHFPHYKHPQGYQLIDEDFNLLYGTRLNGLRHLEEIHPGIAAFIAKKAADPSAEHILKLLTDESAKRLSPFFLRNAAAIAFFLRNAAAIAFSLLNAADID